MLAYFSVRATHQTTRATVFVDCESRTADVWTITNGVLLPGKRVDYHSVQTPDLAEAWLTANCGSGITRISVLHESNLLRLAKMGTGK